MHVRFLADVANVVHFLPCRMPTRLWNRQGNPLAWPFCRCVISVLGRPLAILEIYDPGTGSRWPFQPYVSVHVSGDISLSLSLSLLRGGGVAGMGPSFTLRHGVFF